jgi:hypothetical protein
MSRLDRFVFDIYDDPNGQVLKSLVPSIDEIPPFIKTAQQLDSEQISRLPDDRFALVMVDEGRKLPKYAMVDAGNTALSVMYLLKQAHLLPPEAVKVAAQNLCWACDRHNLDVPMQLKVAAKSGMSPVSGKSKKPFAAHAKINRMQFTSPGASDQFTDNPQLGKVDDDKNLQDRTNFDGVQGTNFVELPVFHAKEKVKSEEGAAMEKNAVAGDPSHWTNEHVQGMQSQYKDALAALFAPGAQQKVQVWGDGKGVTPYVDVSGWNPASVEVEDYTPPQQTLLDGKYPVDSYDQVKQAAFYFEENKNSFHPQQRHDYCVKLAHRMSELGMTVPEDVQRYGSTDYAADVDSYLEHRRGLVDEHFHNALDVLLEKRASVRPDTFVEAVAEFDKMASLNWFWGAQVADPWYTVFGPSLEKVAALEWCWDEQGVRIRENDLENLAHNGYHLLKKSFRQDLVDAFCKSPKSTFESLPRPEKLLIGRMAMDRNSGTATE